MRQQGLSQEFLIGIAERVYGLRLARGMSQARLAREARVSRQTLHDLELANKEPSLATLVQIANALGVELVEILEDNPDSQPLTEPQDIGGANGGAPMTA